MFIEKVKLIKPTTHWETHNMQLFLGVCVKLFCVSWTLTRKAGTWTAFHILPANTLPITPPYDSAWQFPNSTNFLFAEFQYEHVRNKLAKLPSAFGWLVSPSHWLHGANRDKKVLKHSVKLFTWKMISLNWVRLFPRALVNKREAIYFLCSGVFLNRCSHFIGGSFESVVLRLGFSRIVVNLRIKQGWLPRRQLNVTTTW